jgi:hypothetical protein
MAEGVEFVFHKLEQSFERAEGLEALHKRTGETVGTLYQLQEVFSAVGISAEAIPGMLLRLQRSMSGVNEEGKSTATDFARLGLNINQLRGQDAATQLNTITAALDKFPKEQAAGLAQNIFGRFAAGDILQLMRSQDVVSRTTAESKKGAQVQEALAVAAERVHEAWTSINREIDTAWAEIATALVPVLDSIEKKVKAMPFEEWGHKIASVIFGLEKAFESGSLSQLLTLSIQIGFEQAMPYVEAFVKGFGASFLEVMKGVADAIGELVGSSLVNHVVDNARMLVQKQKFDNAKEEYTETSQAALTATKEGDQQQAARLRQRASEWRAKMFAAGEAMGRIESEHSSTENQIVADALSKMAGTHPLDAFVKNFKPEANTSPDATLHKLQIKRILESMGINYDAFVAGTASSSVKASSPQTQTDLETSRYKPAHTDLEKMGFVMSGLGRAGLEERKVELLTQIATGINRLSQPQPGGMSGGMINQV